MKIELLKDLPIDRKHGMVSGKILEVVSEDSDRPASYTVIADSGEKVKVWRRECKIVR